MKRYPQIKFDVLILLLTIGILVVVKLFSIEGTSTIVLGKLPLGSMCWFKQITGIDCPTCGLSRSFVAWLDGNAALAWQAHRFSILLLIPLVLQIPYRIFVIVSGRRIRLFSNRIFLQIVSYSYIGLFFLNWLIRIMK